MFIDEAQIVVEAGKGGDGSASFRHEKFMPKGGPDGGDGGNGGAVIFIGKNELHTLQTFRSNKNFKAEDGENGKPKNMHGRNGSDLIIPVPLGTSISDKDSGYLLVDITSEDQVYIAAKGGNGGWGNQHFATSIKQAPNWSKQGLPGQFKHVDLELKVIADVGLVGLPNAGKSTLLSVITNAKPKIANYPFTTLEPQLGVCQYDDKTFVIADIPGLIHGASQGKGLGIEFLKHLKRTNLLLYMLDGNSDDIKADLEVIQKEVSQFDATLYQKHHKIIISKSDTLNPKMRKEISKQFPGILFISSSTGENIPELKQSIIKMLFNNR